MGVNVANAVTFLRIVISVALLFMDPYSWAFVVLFLLCGFTDVLDGRIARRYHIESEFGAKLDSAADLIMFATLMYILLTNVTIPIVVWALVAVILSIKTISFVIGRRSGFLGFRHSSLNRATGALVFVSVPLFLYWEPLPVGIVVCSIAIIAALDEVLTDAREAGYIRMDNGD